MVWKAKSAPPDGHKGHETQAQMNRARFPIGPSLAMTLGAAVRDQCTEEITKLLHISQSYFQKAKQNVSKIHIHDIKYNERYVFCLLRTLSSLAYELICFGKDLKRPDYFSDPSSLFMDESANEEVLLCISED
ncbi:hypothetical protein AVEN_55339-1 [Araneus ventricosus]|uniref:Uncharacterized protein n=1 Tax=Araneus ventricosus TaxID=182803 RepID=A0A4Y2DEP7_ARAVE|nr:hypothetical protein AVEN_55339-1 [Araneus ventricosus]